MTTDLRALPPDTGIPDRLLADVQVMLAHALNTGRRVPASWVEVAVVAERGGMDDAVLRKLARVHEDLAALVAPATPRSLRYLESVHAARRGRRGIRLVRWLTLLSVLFVMAFIGLATLGDVGRGAADFESGVGLELFYNLLFLVTSAGMGATFAGLFAANKHVNDFSFDPRFESSYWVRVLLGVTAGLVLAELAPVGEEGRSLGKPLLALLGGFGVEAVYRLLQRLVDLAASLASAAPSERDVAALEKARSDQREAKAKLDLAQQLTRLRAGVESRDGATVAADLDGLIAELGGADRPPAPAEPVTPFTPEIVPAGAGDMAVGPAPVTDAASGADLDVDEIDAGPVGDAAGAAPETAAMPDDPDAEPVAPKSRRRRSGG